MSLFPSGSLLWVPDEVAVWKAARVQSTFTAGEGEGTVQFIGQDAGEHTLSSDVTGRCLPMTEQSLEDVADMVQFEDLSEAALLHNLRLRFARDEIYTDVGAILLALNPFQELPLYTPEVFRP